METEGLHGLIDQREKPIPFEGHVYFSYTSVTRLYNIYDTVSIIKYLNDPLSW